MTGILDEIKKAADELSFEFSQSSWEDALIVGFRKDLSMAAVLVHAAGLTRMLSGEEWDRLQLRASTLKPALDPHASLRNRATVWIANHALYANEALWNGDYELAKRLLRKGGVRASYGHKTRREIKAGDRKDLLRVSLRERDKRRDWKVCK